MDFQSTAGQTFFLSARCSTRYSPDSVLFREAAPRLYASRLQIGIHCTLPFSPRICRRSLMPYSNAHWQKTPLIVTSAAWNWHSTFENLDKLDVWQRSPRKVRYGSLLAVAGRRG